MLSKKEIYEKVCARFDHSPKDVTVTATMAMEMIDIALGQATMPSLPEFCINRTGDANFECFEKGKCKNCSE